MIPDALITSKDIASGSITFQTKTGTYTPSGKSSERRIRVTFPTANVPVPFAHGLGRKPVTFAPAVPFAAGTIYADYPMVCDSRTIMLKCSVAGVSAEVIVR